MHFLRLKNPLMAIFLLASLLGAFFFFSIELGMTMNTHDHLPRCPFSPDGSICAMTLQEHMSIWQNMFAAIPQKMTNVSSILLALWLSIATFIFRNQLLKYSKFLVCRNLLYIKLYSYISLIDPIKQFTYRGLVNPKVF